MDDLPPEKSRSVTDTFVTLQRDPPLTRIFAPGLAAPSARTTERDGFSRLVKIAAASPAAPAPTITMSSGGIRALFSSGTRETYVARQWSSGARGLEEAMNTDRISRGRPAWRGPT